MESWKVNLISVWFGCFFTGLAISQILPFLPLYISQLGVSSHEALSMWSGLTCKLMLLRASLGMAIAILPRERSGWALSTLSTAQISGVIGGP